MKRFISILLTAIMLLSLTVPALAASIKTSGAASTLKLESVSGTAQLKNASGKDVKATNGARLYNGYKLATEKASYAHVSLDDTKAIKLDASSSSEVFQSGKKLELKVTSGQMFFNVTKPLKSDESLNIRTSTMVTGVRGTSGWVSVIDRYTTQISLLEGTLTITSTDPLTGQQRTITIVGGQTATIVYHGKDQNYESEIIIENQTIRGLIEDGTIRDEHIILEGTGLTVENLQEEDVPGFVAMEVKKDKELQKKIEENSPLSVPEIIGNAEKRLEKEEAAAENADKAIQEKLEKLTADDVDPLFGTSSGGSGGGGSSGGGSSAPTYNLTIIRKDVDGNEITQDGNGNEIDSYTTTSVVGGEPYDAGEPIDIDGYGFVRAFNQDGGATSGTMTSDVTIVHEYSTTFYTLYISHVSITDGSDVADPEEKILGEGAIYTPEPLTFEDENGNVEYVYVDAMLGDGNMEDSVTVTSDMDITYQYYPTSVTLSPNPNNDVVIDAINQFQQYIPANTRGTLNIIGTIGRLADTTISVPANIDVVFTDEADGNNAALAGGLTLALEEGSTLTVTPNSSFYNFGTITGKGTMNVEDGAELINDGIITVESIHSLHVFGETTNNGTLNIGSANGDGWLYLEEDGILTNTGSITVATTNSGVTVSTGAQLINETMEQDTATVIGSLSNTGNIQVSGDLTNRGSLTNTGTLTISGTAANHRELNNDGTINVSNTMTNAGDLINSETGKLNVTGTITVARVIETNGAMMVSGKVTSSTAGTLISVGGGKLTVTGGTLSNTYEGSNSGPLVTASPANEDAQGNPNSIDIQVTNSSTISHSSATCFVIAGANSSLTVNNSSVSTASGDGISSIDEATVSVENGATVTGKTGMAAENSTLTVSGSKVSGTDGNGIDARYSVISVTGGSTVDGFRLVNDQEPNDIFGFRGYGVWGSNSLVTVNGGTVQGPEGGIYFEDFANETSAEWTPGIKVISGTVQSTIVKTFETAIKAGTIGPDGEALGYDDIPRGYGIAYYWTGNGMYYTVTIGDKEYKNGSNLLYPYYEDYDENGDPLGDIAGYCYDSLVGAFSANYEPVIFAERSITPTDAYTEGTAIVSGNGALVIQRMAT